MWQTNNTVEAVAVANGVLYAGGQFTAVSPPGSSSTTPRTYLAAFNASTGALVTSFNVSVNGRVRALAVSPDGTRLYLGGSFTSVAGQTRNRLAALVLPSGALDTGFRADANSNVTALAATATGLYVGGDFTTVGGAARNHVALVNRTSGAVSGSFDTSLDGRVRAISVAPDGSRVVVGGAFEHVDTLAVPAIASLDPASGDQRPWAATGIIPRPPSGECHAAVSDIEIVGTTAYVSSEGDEPGCYEGVYAARVSDGSVIWNDLCLGASQTVAVVGGWLYKGSHQHDCSRVPNGYVGPTNFNDFIWSRITTVRLSDGALGHFSPNTNGAGDTHVGPLASATDGTQLFIAGDFTSVNGASQRGLARFSPNGPNAVPTTPGTAQPVATAAGRVDITVPGSLDDDDGVLTYQLFRDGGSTPVATTTAESFVRSVPTVRFVDAGLAPGSTHTYRVRASDGSATSGLSPVSISVTVSGAAPTPFANVVASAGPSLFWRLADAGTTAADASGHGVTGTMVGGVTRGVAGAIAGNSAVDLNGTTGYLRSTPALTAPASFTQSLWFNTSSKVGGTLLGFSNAATGAGTANDRVVFMENDGKVVFAMRNSATNPTRFTLVRSPNTYRDGRWHQVVASYNGTTMSLSMDGVEVGTASMTTPVAPGTGYLRSGYVDLTNFDAVFGPDYSHQPSPSSFYLDGAIDEVAFYPTVLNGLQVLAQYASGRA
jgi:hypothetical protein